MQFTNVSKWIWKIIADIVLTGHSVDSPKRSKYSDRSDRRETNILQVERVFQHPVNTHK